MDTVRFHEPLQPPVDWGQRARHWAAMALLAMIAIAFALAPFGCMTCGGGTCQGSEIPVGRHEGLERVVWKSIDSTKALKAVAQAPVVPPPTEAPPVVQAPPIPSPSTPPPGPALPPVVEARKAVAEDPPLQDAPPATEPTEGGNRRSFSISGNTGTIFFQSPGAQPAAPPLPSTNTISTVAPAGSGGITLAQAPMMGGMMMGGGFAGYSTMGAPGYIYSQPTAVAAGVYPTAAVTGGTFLRRNQVIVARPTLIGRMAATTTERIIGAPEYFLFGQHFQRGLIAAPVVAPVATMGVAATAVAPGPLLTQTVYNPVTSYVPTTVLTPYTTMVPTTVAVQGPPQQLYAAPAPPMQAAPAPAAPAPNPTYATPQAPRK